MKAIMNLDERRAKFVYEAARLENSAAGRPINPEPWERRDEAFRENMIRAVSMQCGSQRSRSPRALHEQRVAAYEKMGWSFGERRDRALRTHPDLVPYRNLGRAEREKYWVYMKLCDIARRIK